MRGAASVLSRLVFFVDLVTLLDALRLLLYKILLFSNVLGLVFNRRLREELCKSALRCRVLTQLHQDLLVLHLDSEGLLEEQSRFLELLGVGLGALLDATHLHLQLRDVSA